MKVVPAALLVSLAAADPPINHPALPAPARVCIGALVGYYGATYCLSGADVAMDKVTMNCQNGASVYQDIKCAFNVGETTAHVAGAVATVGLGALIAAGFGAGIGQVLEANGIPWPGAPEKRDVLLATNRQPFSTANFTSIRAPYNSTFILEMRSSGDVAKNLTVPFHFERDGWISTYFPEGFQLDPTLLYTHTTDSYDSFDQVSPAVRRYLDPESMGLKKLQLQKRDNFCGDGPRPITADSGYPAISIADGFGLKYETESVCGHPSAENGAQEDYLNIVDASIQYLYDNNKAVLEVETHTREGYSQASTRMVIETRDFDSCFEGQHLDAYCSF